MKVYSLKYNYVALYFINIILFAYSQFRLNGNDTFVTAWCFTETLDPLTAAPLTTM